MHYRITGVHGNVLYFRMQQLNSVMISTGSEGPGGETMQEALSGAFQGASGGTNPFVNLITGFYLENHRKNASEVSAKCQHLSFQAATPSSA